MAGYVCVLTVLCSLCLPIWGLDRASFGASGWMIFWVGGARADGWIGRKVTKRNRHQGGGSLDFVLTLFQANFFAPY